MPNQNAAVQKLLYQLQQSPNIRSNPEAQEMLNVILTGDSKRGEEIANQILQKNGVSREEGVNRARSFFSNLLSNNQSQQGGPKRR